MSAITTFRHCPICTNPSKIQGNQITCTKCDFEFYDNPRSAACIVLHDEHSRVLLVARASDPGRGLWDLPGGFAVPGETLEGGARREAREELGIDAGSLLYIGSYPDQYLYGGITYDTLGAVFEGRINADAAFKLSGEISETRFFAQDDLPWDRLAFPSLKLTLESIIRPLVPPA